jgi:hypothetical protein
MKFPAAFGPTAPDAAGKYAGQRRHVVRSDVNCGRTDLDFVALSACCYSMCGGS